MTRIKISETTDARNARMWRKFSAAADNFAKHLILIEWQDGISPANFAAWNEGQGGLFDRAKRGVPGYGDLILASLAD